MLSEEEAITRCDKEEVFENIQFLEKTRKNYLQLLNVEKNIEIVDASKSLQEVQDNIRKIIKEKLEFLCFRFPIFAYIYITTTLALLSTRVVSILDIPILTIINPRLRGVGG